MYGKYIYLMTYLKKYRKQKKLTQEELAKILGCSTSLVANCEKGIRRITPDNAVKWEIKTNGELTRIELSPYHFSDLPKNNAT